MTFVSALANLNFMWRDLTLRMEYLMKLYPDMVSADLRKSGEALYSVKTQPPPEVAKSTIDSLDYQIAYKAELQKLLDFIIEDLSIGAPTLAVASAGIYYAAGKFENFVLPLGQEPHHDWIYIFRLRNLFALPTHGGTDFAQEDMNNLLYAILCLKAELNS